MPHARLLKDYFDGREHHKKGAVVEVSQAKLDHDAKRSREKEGRQPLFHPLAPKPVAEKPAAPKPAIPAAKPAGNSIA